MTDDPDLTGMVWDDVFGWHFDQLTTHQFIDTRSAYQWSSDWSIRHIDKYNVGPENKVELSDLAGGPKA